MQGKERDAAADCAAAAPAGRTDAPAPQDLARGLRRSETWQRLLADSAAAMLQPGDPGPPVAALLEQVGPTLGADLFFCYRLDEVSGALVLEACGGLDATRQAAFARLEPGQALCGSGAQRRLPLCLEDVQHADDEHAALVRELGVRAYAGHPLLAGDRWLGTLGFASRGKDRFEPEELAFIAALSRHLALASERQRAERALRESERLLAAERAARTGAERAARLKDELLATLSHDLRTPLNAIVGWTHVIGRAAGENPQLRQGIEVIARNAQAQARLLSDLLDMNRLLSGELPLEAGPVDLARVAAEAADTLRPGAGNKGVELRLELPPALPAPRGDAARLQQVLRILLGNALKRTPAGGRVTLAAQPQDGGVRLAIEDSGEGLDPALLPHFFERSGPAEGAAAHGPGGPGLGLSIARELVELHGGRIGARSEGPGRGTRLEIHLPAPAG